MEEQEKIIKEISDRLTKIERERENDKKKAQKEEVKSLKNKIKSLEYQVRCLEQERDMYKNIIKSYNILSVPFPSRVTI